MTRFKPGDKVLTLYHQGHLAGACTLAITETGVGCSVDGTLRQYGAFDEQGLVNMPVSLDFQQGSTLSCAALTAWNGLYGLESKALKPGDTVLTQGTGGVSMFALQVGSQSTNFHDPEGEILTHNTVRQSRGRSRDLHNQLPPKS